MSVGVMAGSSISELRAACSTGAFIRALEHQEKWLGMKHSRSAKVLAIVTLGDEDFPEIGIETGSLGNALVMRLCFQRRFKFSQAPAAVVAMLDFGFDTLPARECLRI